MARKRGREPLAELTAPAYAAGAEAALEAGSCDQQQAEPPAKRRCGAEMQGRMPAAVALGPSRPAVSASAVREEQANVDNSAKIQNATPPESVAEFRSPSFQVVVGDLNKELFPGRTRPLSFSSPEIEVSLVLQSCASSTFTPFPFFQTDDIAQSTLTKNVDLFSAL